VEILNYQLTLREPKPPWRTPEGSSHRQHAIHQTYSTAQATMLLILVTRPILFFIALVSRQAILFSKQSVLGGVIG